MVSGANRDLGGANKQRRASGNLDQAFSPDGRSILILQGRDREVRIADATTGGDGRRVAWQADDVPGWQRLAP